MSIIAVMVLAGCTRANTPPETASNAETSATSSAPATSHENERADVTEAGGEIAHDRLPESNRGHATRSDGETSPSDSDEDDTTAVDVQLITLSKKNLPEGVAYQGKASRIVGWHDRLGENFVVFSSRDATGRYGASTYLYVNHFLSNDQGTTRVREVRDRVEECDLDMVAEFIDPAVEVTDLDGDDIGEITFAYALSCRGDVSPDSMKVFVLENGDKYVLRGERRWQLSKTEHIGGTYRADRAFRSAPKAFLKHAKSVWKANEDM